MLLSSHRTQNMLPRLEKSFFTIRVRRTIISCPFARRAGSIPLRSSSFLHYATLFLPNLITFLANIYTEKLLANGDKWEPELAAVIRADAPYR